MLYYDYDRQVWVRDDIIQDCGHVHGLRCSCYGRQYAGQSMTTHVASEGRPSVNHTPEATDQ